MKKLLALVIVLLLVLSISALAEGTIDLSGLSLEELVGLKGRINDELHNRIGFDDSAIFSGKYTVGEIILPGMYTITCTESGIYGLALSLNSPDGERLETIILNVGETGFIQLEAGVILEIDDGSGIMRPSDPTWAIK